MITHFFTLEELFESTSVNQGSISRDHNFYISPPIYFIANPTKMEAILELKRQEREKQAQRLADDRRKNLQKAREAKTAAAALRKNNSPPCFKKSASQKKKKKNKQNGALQKVAMGFENPLDQSERLVLANTNDLPETAILTRMSGNEDVDQAKRLMLEGISMIKDGNRRLDEVASRSTASMAHCHWSKDRTNNNELAIYHNRTAHRLKKTSVTKRSTKAGVSEVFGRATATALTATTRESERLTRIEASNLLEKCAIFFINDQNITYIKRNRTTILNLAFRNFSKLESLKFNSFLKCSAGEDGNSTVISFKDETVSVTLDKMPLDTVESLVNPEMYSNNITAELNRHDDEQNNNNDAAVTSIAARSATFSPLRTRTFAFDEKLPVYVIDNIFVQLGEEDDMILDSSITTEEERGCDPEVVQSLLNHKKTRILNKIVEVKGLSQAKKCFRFAFPYSFRLVSEQILNKFGHLLDKKKRRRTNNGNTIKDINSQAVLQKIEDCFVELLQSHRESIKQSSYDKYRDKFIRYYLFCATQYLLNGEEFGVLSTVFSALNLKLYLYAHGPHVKRDTLLASAKFFNSHLFVVNQATNDAKIVQQYIDEEYSSLRYMDTKYLVLGKPNKLSVHTRSLVSALMFVYNEMRTGEMLLKTIPLEHTNRHEIEAGTRTAAETLIFLFGTFVYLHRWSDVTALTNKEVLQLALGQAHLLDSKAKAVSLNKHTKNPTGKKGNARIRNLIKSFQRARKRQAGDDYDQVEEDDEEEKEEEEKEEEEVDHDPFRNYSVVDSSTMAASALNVCNPCVIGLPLSLLSALGLPMNVVNTYAQLSSDEASSSVAAPKFGGGMGESETETIAREGRGLENERQSFQQFNGPLLSEQCAKSEEELKRIRARNAKISTIYGVDLNLPFPPAENMCLVKGFFKNVCGELLHEYYRADVTIACLGDLLKSAKAQAQQQKNKKKTKKNCNVVDDTNSVLAKLAKEDTVFDFKTFSSNSRMKDLQYGSMVLNKEVKAYLCQLPFRDVFITVNDIHPTTDRKCVRVLNMGDLAIKAIMTKLALLGEDPDDRAITVSDATMKKVTQELIMVDLVNFGLDGSSKSSIDEQVLLEEIDSKIRLKQSERRKHNRATNNKEVKRLQKLKKHLQDYHRQRLSSMKKFSSMPLDARQAFAAIHYAKNIKTATHLGRVTGASWLVDAVKNYVCLRRYEELKSRERSSTVASGCVMTAVLERATNCGNTSAKNSEEETEPIWKQKVDARWSLRFISMFTDVGAHHLCHSEFSNTVKYYSENCIENEEVQGLRGFLSRAAGRHINSVGGCNQDFITNENNSLLVSQEILKQAFSKQKVKIYGKYTDKSSLLGLMAKYWVTSGKPKTDRGFTSSFTRNCNLDATQLQYLWKSPYDPITFVGGFNVPLVDKVTNFYHFSRPTRLVHVTKGSKAVTSAFICNGNLADTNRIRKSNREAHTDYIHAAKEEKQPPKKRPRNSDAANISQISEVLADSNRAVVSARKNVVLFHNPSSKLEQVQNARDYVDVAELISNFNPANTTLSISKTEQTGEAGGGSHIDGQRTSRLDATLVGLGASDKRKTLAKYTTDLNCNKTSHRLTSSVMSATHRLLNNVSPNQTNEL